MIFLYLSLHIAGIAIGCFLIWVALCTYQDTEKEVKNRLYEFYFKLANVKERMNRVEGFLVVICKSLYLFLNKYFYSGKISFQFFGSCFIIFFCSIALFAPFFVGERMSELNALQFYYTFGLPLGIITLLVWLLFPNIVKFKFLYLGCCIIFFVCEFLLESGGLDYLVKGLDMDLFFLIIYIYSTMLVYCTIKINKYVYMRNGQTPKRVLKISLFAMFAEIVIKSIISFLFFLIYVLVYWIKQGSVPGPDSISFAISLYEAIAFLPILFYFAALIVIYLLMVLSRFIWPFSMGFIKMLYQHDLIKRKKLLLLVGLSLITISYSHYFPNTLIEKVMKFIDKRF